MSVKKYLTQGIVALLALSATCCIQPARNPVLSDTARTVALMQDMGEGYMTVCGGVWVNAEYILTANHCTIGDEYSDTIELKSMSYIAETDSEIRRDAAVVYRDEPHDLALLRATSWPAHTWAVAAKVAPSVGARLHVIGHPMGILWVNLVGTVSQYGTRMPPQAQDTGPYMLAQVPVARGSSGGPAFDSEGLLVGITDSVSTGVPGQGFFIPASSIRAFLKSSGIAQAGR